MSAAPTLSTDLSMLRLTYADLAVALGEHLLTCGSCQSDRGPGCSTGETLLETVMRAATRLHDARGWRT